MTEPLSPSEVLHDASYSECEACCATWEAGNHSVLAAKHRKSTGHATVTHTDRAVRHAASPELAGQVMELFARQEAA